MIKSTPERDEQSRFDSALNDPDHLLLDSLRRDDARRRRRRLALIAVSLGGLIMLSAIAVPFVLWWLTLETTSAGTNPPTALDEDARIERADALAAEGWQLWQQQKLADA